MRTIFLADAHLRDPADDNYQKLMAFLKSQCGQLDQLVLLGDIFEFWIDYRNTVLPAYAPLLRCLECLHRAGTRLIYVEGNHDYHMGSYFQETLQCRVLPDGGTLEIDDLKVHISHGDLVNPDDKGYRLLRSFLRSGLIRWLTHVVPPGITWKIATWGSDRSKRSRNEKGRHRPARNIIIPYAEKLLEAGHDIVITGHFHEPFDETLPAGRLIALGDWISQFSYAVYEDGIFSLLTLESTHSS